MGRQWLPRERSNHTGEVWGELTITAYSRTATGSNGYWYASCTCGTEDEYRYDRLKTGRVTDCGCAGDPLQGRSIGRYEVRSVVDETTRAGRKNFNAVCTDCGEAFTATRTRLLGETQSVAHRCAVDKYSRLVGETFGRLTVTAYSHTNDKGYFVWNAVCACGQTTTAITPELNRGNKRSCGCLQREAASSWMVEAWQTGGMGKGNKGRAGREEASYITAHRRVWNAKGKASEYLCVECDAPADHWAYDHKDPDEVTAHEDGPNIGQVYSLKIEHYLPMCRGCHKAFDLDWDNGYRVEVSV